LLGSYEYQFGVVKAEYFIEGKGKRRKNAPRNLRTGSRSTGQLRRRGCCGAFIEKNSNTTTEEGFYPRTNQGKRKGTRGSVPKDAKYGWLIRSFKKSPRKNRVSPYKKKNPQMERKQAKNRKAPRLKNMDSKRMADFRN